MPLLAVALVATAVPKFMAQAAGGPNLAVGKATSVSSTNGSFVAGNLNDGNQGSYWESSGALPQWARPSPTCGYSSPPTPVRRTGRSPSSR